MIQDTDVQILDKLDYVKCCDRAVAVAEDIKKETRDWLHRESTAILVFKGKIVMNVCIVGKRGKVTDYNLVLNYALDDNDIQTLRDDVYKMCMKYSAADALFKSAMDFSLPTKE